MPSAGARRGGVPIGFGQRAIDAAGARTAWSLACAHADLAGIRSSGGSVRAAPGARLRAARTLVPDARLPADVLRAAPSETPLPRRATAQAARAPFAAAPFSAVVAGRSACCCPRFSRLESPPLRPQGRTAWALGGPPRSGAREAHGEPRHARVHGARRALTDGPAAKPPGLDAQPRHTHEDPAARRGPRAALAPRGLAARSTPRTGGPEGRRGTGRPTAARRPPTGRQPADDPAGGQGPGPRLGPPAGRLAVVRSPP